MIKFKAQNRKASIENTELLTSNSVGIKVEFEFSEEWNGLHKIACFENGCKQIKIDETSWDNGTCTIPPEMFKIAGAYIRIGVYGCIVTGETVLIAIPTVYANLGKVERGADGRGEEDSEESATLIEQLAANKLDKPVQSGTEGQVLTLGDDGRPVWADSEGSTVDQSYNPTSANAQSGTAVAQASISTLNSAKAYTDTRFSGANQAISFVNYAAMIQYLNDAPKDEFKTGQNFYIVTRDVPDVWVSFVNEASSQYTYTTDADFIQYINGVSTFGGVVGYYVIAPLETQKVDLTDYVAKSEISETPTINDENPVSSDGVARSLAQALTLLEESYVAKSNLAHETWTFTLDDGTEVDKEVVLWNSQQ